jgi:21S rRNA (GM2251-2'-O)-methyltransferase
LPVPIVGEAVYGSHAVYSALVNQKRKLNHMYILASIAHDVKRAVRPDNFLDKDVVKNQKNEPNSSQNNDDSDNDSLFDSSFLIDSSSTKVKSILTNFQSDLDDDLTHIHDEGQIDSLGKYVSPHHIESTREQLTAIYELAQTIPNLKITPLKRDKLDLLAANRPHNGIILDAQPLIPVKTDALTQDHFFVSNKFQPKLKTAEVNTKPSKQIQSDSNKQQQTENNTENTKPAVYFALESIFDPNNLGAILRSSTFFGIDGLILPHNSCPLSPAVAKVSSGALDFMNIIQCSNLDNFLTKSLANSRYTSAEGKQSYMDITRDNNTRLVRNFDKLCIVGLGLTDEVHSVSGADIFNFVNTIVQNDKSTTKDPFSILVIAGNEGFGLSPQIAAKCHLLLKIPTFQQFPTHFNNIKIKPVVDSLNVSNAVAIALNDVIASKQKLNM